MRITWDSGKASANLRKHGVDFADAVLALEDGYALTIEDRDHDERRYKTLGQGPDMKLLVVVHATCGRDCIRILSARRATRVESRQYHRGLHR